MAMLARSESKISEFAVIIFGSVFHGVGARERSSWAMARTGGSKKAPSVGLSPLRRYFLDSHVIMSLLIFDVKILGALFITSSNSN